jgi:hypothetical protein
MQLLGEEGGGVWTARPICSRLLAHLAQGLEAVMDESADLAPRDAVRDEPPQSAGRLVRQPQRHCGDPWLGLAQPPASSLLEAEDIRPGEVLALLVFDDLDEAADVDRADVPAHVPAAADTDRSLADPLPSGHTREEADVRVGLADDGPDGARTGPDGHGVLDAHGFPSYPRNGNRRSRARPLSESCMRPTTSA